MIQPALVASFVLALVFAFAAGAKLSDVRGTRAAMRHLGVPNFFVAPLGVLAAPFELGAAFLLLTAPRHGALAALGLLAVFSAALAPAWFRGSDEGCSCFGPLLKARPGASLMRNAALALLSAIIVAGPAASGLHTLPAILLVTGIGSCALAASRIALRQAAGAVLPVVRQTPSFQAGPTPAAPIASRREAIGVAAAAGAVTWLGGLTGWTAPTAEARILTGLACDPFTHCCCACTCNDRGQCNCGCSGCVGIAGGGTLATTAGTASFSIFASAMAFRLHKSKKKPLVPFVLGSLQWSDPGAGISLKSTRIDSYGPVGDSDTMRRVQGIAEVVEHGQLSFVLTTDDGGAPGSGADTVDFKLGAAAGGDGSFSYSASGPLSAGDIHRLTVQLFTPQA